MEHECPTCGRRLSRMEDYPRIYIDEFQRMGSFLLEPIKEQNPRIHDRTTRVVLGTSHSYDSETGRREIFEKLNPYFTKLQSLVGQEVDTRDALPWSEEFRMGRVLIPDTVYNLEMYEIDGHGPSFLKSKGLKVPDLKTLNSGTKKLAFLITQRGGGGSITRIKYLATVGGLEYQGRLIGKK